MRYAIVGASAAGLAAARSILDLDPASEVVLLSDEAEAPYCRPLISYWLAGEAPADLFALPLPPQTQAELRLGARVRSLDAGAKRLVLESGETLAYDRVLVASGAAAARLGVPGEDAGNVFAFRTRADAEGLASALDAGARRAVVLGGGLVGVKASHALAARGVAVTLCLASAFPLSQAVDATAGALVAEALAGEGIEVRTGLSPAGFEVSDGRAGAVLFEGGERLPCDVAVVGKGVTPRSELLSTGWSGGIPVDAALRTPLPDVWAAGDVALAFDAAWGARRLNAIWPIAVEQGTLAGRNMAGAGETYPGGLAMNSLKVGSLELVSAGITRAPDRSCEERTALDRRRGWYRKVVLRQGKLVGAILAGAPEQAGLVISAIRRGARLDELPFDPLVPGVHWGRYAFS